MLKIEKIAELNQVELELLYIGFQQKWEKLLKKKTFQEFCRLYQSTDSRERYYRILEAGELAGVFGISDFFSRKKQVKGHKKQVSDWRWYFGKELLNDSVARNECYLSFLVVGNAFQGQGIGKACLQFIEEQSREKAEIKCVTLFVSTSNQRAIALYKRAGFEVDRKVSSLLTKYFVDEKSWYKMKKRLR